MKEVLKSLEERKKKFLEYMEELDRLMEEGASDEELEVAFRRVTRLILDSTKDYR